MSWAGSGTDEPGALVLSGVVPPSTPFTLMRSYK